MKSQRKSIEIPERFEVELALVELGPQADKKVVQTSHELNVTPEQDFRGPRAAATKERSSPARDEQEWSPPRDRR